MRITLRSFIVPSIPLAVLLVIGCMLLWLSDFGFSGFHLPLVQSGSQGDFIASLVGNSLITTIIIFSVTLLNAFLLAQINNKFTIIRIRTFLPILIFLLLMAAWYPTHTQISPHIALTLSILAVFNFFNMLRNNKASEEAFLGCLLISVSSLIINEYIFLIPVCWIGFIIFQSLSLRTFLASVMGALAPWVLYISIIYLINPNTNLYNLFSVNINFGINFASFSLIQFIYGGAMILIFIFGLIGLISMSRSDAIQTRNKLNFLMLLIFSLVVLSVIFMNHLTVFLPLIAFIYALLLSHPLTLNQNNNFNGLLFIIFITLNLAFIFLKNISL